MLGLLLATNLNQEQFTYTKTAHRSAEVLMTLLNNVLDFSKFEAKKVVLDNENFAILPLIQDIISLHAYIAKKKNIKLQYKISNSTPSAVFGDITRLRQVLNNLVGNALKFTSFGQVSILVNSISPPNSQQVVLEFSICDTGIGIAEEQLPRLFQPFSQADTSTTRKFGGTGLGLAICKSIVELMQGSISINSAIGKGTTVSFRVTLSKPTSNEQYSVKRILCCSDPTLTPLYHHLRGRQYELTVVDLQNGFKSEVSHKYDLYIVNNEALHNADLIPILEKAPVLRVLDNEQNTLRDKENILSLMGNIWLPISEEQVDDAVNTCKLIQQVCEPSSPIKNRFLGNNVLLAEDNKINQKVVEKMLEKLGVSCQTVCNGLEAVQAAQQFPFNLILLDVNMPEMDGFQASREICHQFNAMGKTPPPIIALTALTSEADREIGLANGMVDFLVKPISLPILQAMLEKHLRR